MEANPGSADADKFCSFREAGVNRLSIGIQSFDDALLQSLGRVHNSDQVQPQGVKVLRVEGKELLLPVQLRRGLR